MPDPYPPSVYGDNNTLYNLLFELQWNNYTNFGQLLDVLGSIDEDNTAALSEINGNLVDIKGLLTSILAIMNVSVPVTIVT